MNQNLPHSPSGPGHAPDVLLTRGLPVEETPPEAGSATRSPDHAPQSTPSKMPPWLYLMIVMILIVLVVGLGNVIGPAQ